MSAKARIPRRVSTALLNSLAAGVTPRVGLEHIVVGRKSEITALLQDTENIAQGGASFRIIAGRYGSGKSFMLQILRNYAMDRDFVVADADLSPERRLAGTAGQGVATYRELIGNLATKLRPDGGSLRSVLERWIGDVQKQVITEGAYRPNDPAFTDAVEQKLFEVTTRIAEQIHGFDFATVIAAYWRGQREGHEERSNAAMRWLRGEYTTKTEANRDLGVRVIIDDDNWYDHLKLIASFVTAIGYKGLLVMIDEAVNLYKIVNTVSRQNNYEKLLSMLNDTLQGQAEHLGFVIGGTVQFIEDQRRGLYSYEALRSRLQGNRFAANGLIDLAGPVIPLGRLSNEEILLLLRKIKEIHALHYDYESTISDADLVAFMEEVLNRLGAEDFLTPRDVIRDFTGVMNILVQNRDLRFGNLVANHEIAITDSDAATQAQREDEIPAANSTEIEL